MRTDWYQNNSSIFIDIFAKNLQEEDVTVQFTNETVHVRIDKPENWEKQWVLAASIDASNSKFIVGKVKIEIEMRKAEENATWSTLEKGASCSSTQPLKYPSSARKPVSEASIDLPEEEPTGEAAVNALFQQIYANASEDTRRAMMKSFVESKGTVLSTNWDEVGAKHIDPVPPK